MADQALAALAGAWTGSYRLWLEPGQPARDFTTTLTATVAPSRRYLTLDYAWRDTESAQDGVLVFILGAEAVATAMWVDTFHMHDRFMACRGTHRDGAIEVLGRYSAPPGPDWGWRTRVAWDAQSMTMQMFNVAPDAKEYAAVEANYRRAEGGR